MRKDKLIKLISITSANNDIGDSVDSPIKREVFAEKKSIRQSEFYQAAGSGLRPELTFIVWAGEYNQEPRLEFEGKEYIIIRTYNPNSRDTELICQGVVNGVV